MKKTVYFLLSAASLLSLSLNANYYSNDNQNYQDDSQNYGNGYDQRSNRYNYGQRDNQNQNQNYQGQRFSQGYNANSYQNNQNQRPQDQGSYDYKIQIYESDAPNQNGRYVDQNSNGSPDQSIASNIRNALQEALARRNQNVEVRVLNGNVILSGTVENASDRQTLESVVSRIKGVRNVDNRIEVKNSSLNNRSTYSNDDLSRQNPIEKSDQDIVKKIDDAIKPGYFSKGYPNVEFDVNSGNVILSGYVEKESDKKDLAEKIQKFDGVKAVDNRLSVRNPRAVNDDNDDQNNDYNTVNGDNSAQALNKADIEIAKKIDGYLKPGFFSKGYPNIGFRVQNGYVILNGALESENDKRDLTEKVQKIDGVKRIDNQIVVVNQKQTAENSNSSGYSASVQGHPSALVEQNDLELTKEVNDLIKPGLVGNGYPNVTFIIDKGNVILKGTVEKDSDKKDLLVKVQKIKGVKHVEDHINVVNAK